jgi:soluble lytic murein transglycosylase-like protein
MKSSFYFIGLLAAIPAFAGEYAVLGNGFRIHADRHEMNGTMVRLHQGEGVTELPAASVITFETEEARETPQAKAAEIPPPETIPEPVENAGLAPPELAARAARKFALPESFVTSVMLAESGFHQTAVSPKGATGLMQLMPETAQHLGVDPKNPAENAEGGAKYLRDLLARYENQPDQVLLALAAYNAGPGAIEKYHGIPPYRETREYILRVLKNWDQSDSK